MSKQTDSILSIGEHAAMAIARAHESFKSAKSTGAYGNALLMNYAELKAIIDRFEFMVCGIAGEIGYPCNLTARVVPTKVKPVIEPEAEIIRDELLKAAAQVDNAIDTGETILLVGVAEALRYAASAPSMKRPRDTEPDNRTKAAIIRRCIDELPIIGERYADSADTVNAALLELRAIADDMEKRG